jgi:hypothetical protein
MDQRDDRRDPADEPDPPEQTWGQGEGEHEPTIEGEEQEDVTYSEGTARSLDDPEALAREDEGMDR